jgi:glycosyltransferase involved in cell wall biosynthesis
MEENGIKMDVVIVSHLDDGYSPETVADFGVKNADLGHITEYYRKAKFLLVPSTTECITLVAGEALANGCIPITLETKDEEHKQFFNCITPHSIDEFNKVIMGLSKSDHDPEEVNRQKIFEFTNKMWSIEKTLEELRVIFGTGNNSKINLMYDDYEVKGEGDCMKTIPYRNAVIITGETIN